MNNTKQNLIDAATRLFSRQGFDGTSVGEVEEAAGLTPRAGGFYRHFKSKDELLITIVESKLVETPEKLGLHLFPLGDTRAELLVLGKEYLRINKESTQISQIVARELHRLPKLRKKIRQSNAGMLEGLAAWIKTRKAARALTKEQLAQLVLLVFGGWLFYLTKKSQDEKVNMVDADVFLESWASYWSITLDKPGSITGMFDEHG